MFNIFYYQFFYKNFYIIIYMNLTILLILFIIIIFFIYYLKNNWNQTEKFGQFLWMPTRFTRLMSYDLRGDPYSFVVYPPYYSLNAPFATYLYRTDRYAIDGNYYKQKPSYYNQNDDKNIVFKKSSYLPEGEYQKYVFKTRKS